MSHPPADEPRRTAQAVPQRMRMLRFIVLFFVITFVLLLGYRMVVDTLWMARYLFTVGEHTAMTLDLFAHEASVELLDADYPGQRDPALLRAQTEALLAGEDPPRRVESDGAAEPLSRWEHFLHRNLMTRWEYRDNLSRLERLASALPLPSRLTLEALDEFVRERTALLERLLAYPGPDGEVRIQGDPEAVRALRRAQHILDTVDASAQLPQEQRGEQLTQAAQALEDSRIAQATRLQQSVGQRDQPTLGAGPLVYYIQTPSLRRQIRGLEAELQAADAPGEASAIRSELAQLTEARQALVSGPEGEQADGEVMFVFQVISECGAIQSMSIYVAAVLAFPALWWKRLVGVAAGLPILYAVNIGRLASLAVIGAYFPDWFKFAHEVVWQGVYIVFVVAAWLLWMEVVVRPRRPRRAGA